MNELETRRSNVFNRMKENSVAIFFAGTAKIKSADEFFPFFANRNFFYLTGIEQENSILMLIKGIGEKKTYLFVDEYSELKEKWTGRRITYDEARVIASINDVETTNNFENVLSLVCASEKNQYGKIDTVYLDLEPELKIKDAYSTEDLKTFINSEYPHVEVENSFPILTNLRMIKSSEEVENIVHAIGDTNFGISQVLLKMKPNIKEHELADYFEYFGKIHDKLDLAFSTIVASGKNATCLHYPSQNDTIKPNDLVLFDLGYKYKGYSADISRTYPVSGKFVGKQRDVYEAVLNANKEIINYVRAGMKIMDLQNHCKEFLKSECVRLGLLKEEDDITRVYYHNVSHFLGQDTHDVGSREKPLEDGNVITVEPGLYFADLGIGVRVEDDVLIAGGKGQCLSRAIVKEIDEIEKLLAGRKL